MMSSLAITASKNTKTAVVTIPGTTNSTFPAATPFHKEIDKVDLLPEPKLTSLPKVSSDSFSDPDLEKLAEKIKAARRIQPSVTAPEQNLVKLELPVLHIKKEVPDSELPPIKMTEGYSKEPEVITICDSDDEEDYHARHSQGGQSVGCEDDDCNDEIKEEILSDTEGRENYEVEELEDDEEIEILKSSENKLFAGISKRIKVEFDESPDLNAKTFFDEINVNDNKEQELINMIIETVGCDADIAICGVAQAKENFGCDDPTVEQVVEVITGESWNSSSEGDDSFDQPVEETVTDDLPELASTYKIPKVTSKSP